MVLLATLMVSIFHRQRASGQRAICINNIKQVNMALSQYVRDNDSTYPNLVYPRYDGWKEVLQPYLKNTQAYECPTASTVVREEHYALNSLLLTTRGYVLQRGVSEAKHEPLDASKVWTVFDTTFGAEIEIPSSCGSVKQFSVRHSGGANAGFVDGHVKWLTFQAFDVIGCSVLTGSK
jgi:prepilin-type processing-associated H-X9-DG protein